MTMTQDEAVAYIERNKGLLVWTINKYGAARLRGSSSSRIDREDLEKRCWEYLLRYLPRYDPAKGVLANWFVVICRGAIQHAFREDAWQGVGQTVEGRQEISLDALQSWHEPGSATGNQGDVAVKMTLDDLSAEARFVLHGRMAGMTETELAQLLDTTTYRVQTIYNGARKKIARELALDVDPSKRQKFTAAELNAIRDEVITYRDGGETWSQVGQRYGRSSDWAKKLYSGVDVLNTRVTTKRDGTAT
jgi:RNA polymerase sigma factor (sigma-70 family)